MARRHAVSDRGGGVRDARRIGALARRRGGRIRLRQSAGRYWGRGGPQLSSGDGRAGGGDRRAVPMLFRLGGTARPRAQPRFCRDRGPRPRGAGRALSSQPARRSPPGTGRSTSFGWRRGCKRRSWRIERASRRRPLGLRTPRLQRRRQARQVCGCGSRPPASGPIGRGLPVEGTAARGGGGSRSAANSRTGLTP